MDKPFCWLQRYDSREKVSTDADNILFNFDLTMAKPLGKRSKVGDPSLVQSDAPKMKQSRIDKKRDATFNIFISICFVRNLFFIVDFVLWCRNEQTTFAELVFTEYPLHNGWAPHVWNLLGNGAIPGDCIWGRNVPISIWTPSSRVGVLFVDGSSFIEHRIKLFCGERNAAIRELIFWGFVKPRISRMSWGLGTSSGDGLLVRACACCCRKCNIQIFAAAAITNSFVRCTLLCLLLTRGHTTHTDSPLYDALRDGADEETNVGAADEITVGFEDRATVGEAEKVRDGAYKGCIVGRGVGTVVPMIGLAKGDCVCDNDGATVLAIPRDFQLVLGRCTWPLENYLYRRTRLFLRPNSM